MRRTTTHRPRLNSAPLVALRKSGCVSLRYSMVDLRARGAASRLDTGRLAHPSYLCCSVLGSAPGSPALHRTGMDLFDTIASSQYSARPVPNRWTSSPCLAEHKSLADVAAAIDRLDDTSDTVLAELLSLDLHDQDMTPAILLGLRGLIFLCRGRDRELLNDLTTEVAMVIGEMRRVRPVSVGRRLGYVIVDRARDRQRAALRRQLARPVFDPMVVAETVADPAPAVDDVVIERLRLQALRRQVETSGDPGLARSWNTLLVLIEAPRSSQAERDRWKYVRRRLVQHFDPDHAA